MRLGTAYRSMFPANLTGRVITAVYHYCLFLYYRAAFPRRLGRDVAHTVPYRHLQSAVGYCIVLYVSCEPYRLLIFTVCCLKTLSNSCFLSHACQCGMFLLIYQHTIFSGDIFRKTAVFGQMRADAVCFLRLFMSRLTAKKQRLSFQYGQKCLCNTTVNNCVL